MSSMMSAATFLVATLFTFFGILLAGLYFYFMSDIRGAASQVNVVINRYNEVLSSWLGYALANDLNQSYPVAIEIEAEKTPFGIRIKQMYLIVKCGFKESKYEVVSRSSPDLRFAEEKLTTFRLVE